MICGRNLHLHYKLPSKFPLSALIEQNLKTLFYVKVKEHDNRWVWDTGGMIMPKENRSAWKELSQCHSCLPLSNTYPKWTAMRSNHGLHSERLETLVYKKLSEFQYVFKNTPLQ
jgi:hypothetical protein